MLTKTLSKFTNVSVLNANENVRFPPYLEPHSMKVSFTPHELKAYVWMW